MIPGKIVSIGSSTPISGWERAGRDLVLNLEVSFSGFGLYNSSKRFGVSVEMKWDSPKKFEVADLTDTMKGLKSPERRSVESRNNPALSLNEQPCD
jgi:hypothetical protein